VQYDFRGLAQVPPRLALVLPARPRTAPVPPRQLRQREPAERGLGRRHPVGRRYDQAFGLLGHPLGDGEIEIPRTLPAAGPVDLDLPGEIAGQ